MNLVTIIKTGMALFSLAAAASCTKTDTIAPPADAQNRILSYKVTGVPAGEQPVIGAIDDTDSTITIYLPSYFALEVILPEITVSEGASVTPASGTIVENLITMLQNKQPVNYKVTGKNGSTRTYTLRIISQQPQTTVNELSADPAKPALFELADYFNMNFTGTNIITENRPNLVKVVFTNEQGVDLPVVSAQNAFAAASANSFSIQIVRALATDAAFIAKLTPDGLYKVTIYNYGQVIKLKNPVQIKNIPK